MNDIQRLLPRHYGLLRLVLAGTSSHSQMAEMLGYTPEGLRNVIQSPLFQDELARRRSISVRQDNETIRDGLTQSRDLINKTSVAAVETIERVMATSPDPKIQLDAADKILKYAFPRGDTQKGGNNGTTVVVLDSAKLDRLREALNESGLSTDKTAKPVQATIVSEPTFSVNFQN